MYRATRGFQMQDLLSVNKIMNLCTIIITQEFGITYCQLKVGAKNEKYTYLHIFVQIFAHDKS